MLLEQKRIGPGARLHSKGRPRAPRERSGALTTEVKAHDVTAKLPEDPVALANTRLLQGMSSSQAPHRLSRMQQLRGGSVGTISGRTSAERAAVMMALLGATLPSTYDGHRKLQPLWANEAMHRAHTTICLIKVLERRVLVPRGSPSVGVYELNLANDIARLIKSVSYTQASTSVSCSSTVKDLVLETVELFGPGAGDVAIETNIEKVVLPAFKVRALVLLAQHLVANALLVGLQFPGGGRITVNLCRTAPTGARLSVITSGPGLVGSQPCSCSVTHDLASLLGATLAYNSMREKELTVCVNFRTRVRSDARLTV
jgi:hypothetical protein